MRLPSARNRSASLAASSMFIGSRARFAIGGFILTLASGAGRQPQLALRLARRPTRVAQLSRFRIHKLASRLAGAPPPPSPRPPLPPPPWASRGGPPCPLPP